MTTSSDTKDSNKRIVVGIDGSATSINALRWAAGYASLTAEAIEVIVVWDWYRSPGSSKLGVAGLDPQGDATHILEKALMDIESEWPDLPMKSRVVEGNPSRDSDGRVQRCVNAGRGQPRETVSSPGCSGVLSANTALLTLTVRSSSFTTAGEPCTHGVAQPEFVSSSPREDPGGHFSSRGTTATGVTAVSTSSRLVLPERRSRVPPGAPAANHGRCPPRSADSPPAAKPNKGPHRGRAILHDRASCQLKTRCSAQRMRRDVARRSAPSRSPTACTRSNWAPTAAASSRPS